MKRNDEGTVQINGITFNDIMIDGLTQLDLSTVANRVEAKMREIQDATREASTLNLAILAALSFAADSYIMETQRARETHDEEKHVDTMLAKLQQTLEKPAS